MALTVRLSLLSALVPSLWPGMSFLKNVNPAGDSLLHGQRSEKGPRFPVKPSLCWVPDDGKHSGPRGFQTQRWECVAPCLSLGPGLCSPCSPPDARPLLSQAVLLFRTLLLRDVLHGVLGGESSSQGWLVGPAKSLPALGLGFSFCRRGGWRW